MKWWWWTVASFAATPSPWKNTAELLQALDRRGIRYPPTATRVELETLWHSGATKRFDDNENKSKGHRPPNRPVTSTAATASTATASTATASSSSLSSSHSSTSNPLSEISEREHRRRRRQRRHQRTLLHAASPFASLLAQHIPSYATTIKATAGDILDQSYRKVRRVKRDIVEAWMEAEDGVRTVPYEYVERFDDVWNRGGNKSHRNAERKKSSSKTEATTVLEENDKDEEGLFPRSARRPPRAAASSTSTATTTTRKQTNQQHQQSSRSMLLLPPAQGTYASFSTSAERNYSKSQRPKKRKIYNPYGDVPSSSSHVNTNDLLDEIGAFFVEAADRAMWINNNDVAATARIPSNGSQQWQQQNQKPQSQQSQQQGAGPSKRTNMKKRKHWKDQWEERFDYMFGLHDDNEPYRRWTDSPAPPEPIVPSPWGRAKRRRGDSRDEPFWGRGSIASLVLSRHEPQLYPWDRVDALWESNSGSVLTVLRWTARGVARWYGKVCRWAAYHETLPQAAVVTFVTAILLSTSKRRLLAAAIALVATRAIGEAVRGEITPWDDNEEENDDEHENEAAAPTELHADSAADKGVIE